MGSNCRSEGGRLSLLRRHYLPSSASTPALNWVGATRCDGWAYPRPECPALQEPSAAGFAVLVESFRVGRRKHSTIMETSPIYVDFGWSVVGLGSVCLVIARSTLHQAERLHDLSPVITANYPVSCRKVITIMK